MLTIKGPRDINGNRREFEFDTRLYVLAANSNEKINVTPAEYRRLAKLFDIGLNAADADEEPFDE